MSITWMVMVERCQGKKLRLEWRRMGFHGGQTIKNLCAVLETQIWTLGWGGPLGKGMITHSSILVWRIPWTEEPGGLRSMGPQRVRYDWVTNIHTHTQQIAMQCLRNQSVWRKISVRRDSWKESSILLKKIVMIVLSWLDNPKLSKYVLIEQSDGIGLLWKLLLILALLFASSVTSGTSLNFSRSQAPAE